MKRIVLVLLVMVSASPLTGCITFLTQINVRGDGSGTMVQTITMNPEQIKKSMEGIAKEMGANVTEPKEPAKDAPAAGPAEGMLKESDFRGKALDLGTGVTFLSAEKIDTRTAAGMRVTYAFKDINLLAVNPKPAAAMGTEGAGGSSQDALKFRLNRMQNGNSVLTVLLPASRPAPPKEQTATPPSAASPPEPDPNMSAMIMQMFKGLHMGIAVNVEGKVIKTNSPYVEGSKVTLMDIDFDPLLSDEKGLRALNEKMETTLGDDRKMMEALKGIHGIKITTDAEVMIEFSPD